MLKGQIHSTTWKKEAGKNQRESLVFSCSPAALVATVLVYEFIATYRAARILHLVHRVASEVSNGSTAIRRVMSYDRGSSPTKPTTPTVQSKSPPPCRSQSSDGTWNHTAAAALRAIRLSYLLDSEFVPTAATREILIVFLPVLLPAGGRKESRVSFQDRRTSNSGRVEPRSRPKRRSALEGLDEEQPAKGKAVETADSPVRHTVRLTTADREVTIQVFLFQFPGVNVGSADGGSGVNIQPKASWESAIAKHCGHHSSSYVWLAYNLRAS
ncbi:hypothetical protein MRB53_036547 [Persea americana]|nr:hypothetical protein MRB53_036825 [Persea americana]KAJ8614681.1 hypothetical protein MRB53_036547 [Persea americana]